MTAHFQPPIILQENEIIFSAANQVTYDITGLSQLRKSNVNVIYFDFITVLCCK